MISSKSVYIKAYTRMNLGDDLFIHILCARYPKHVFYLKDKDKYTKCFEKIQNLNIIEDSTDVKFDAIVYIGGSIFIENSKDSIKRVLELKQEIIKEGIPTYIIGANFGPYMTEKYFNAVKREIISNVVSVVFRDKYSYNLFKDMDNVSYAPDVVFTLDTDKYSKEKKREIGISLIYHLEREKIKDNYSEYLNKMIEIIKYYISIDYDIRLFSFCEYEKDMVAINELLNRISERDIIKIHVSKYNGNVDEILEQISCLSAIVAARFHSMITGFRCRVPVIPICYSNKMKNVLCDMGINNEKICGFENLDELNYKQGIELSKSVNFKDAEKQFKLLDEFFPRLVQFYLYRI